MNVDEIKKAWDKLRTQLGPRLRQCSVVLLLPPSEFDDLTNNPAWHKKEMSELGPMVAVSLNVPDGPLTIKSEPTLFKPEWDVQPGRSNAHL